MTTYFQSPVKCRLCGTESNQTQLGSTNSFGSPDLDLRPPEMQRSTMNAWLQECPHCGYVAPDLSELGPDPTVLESAQYQALRNDTALPALARRFLAFAMIVRDSSSEQAAYSYLRAAWVCDDYGRDEQAAACRGQAIDQFQRGPEVEDNEPSLTRAAVTLDVLRRTGRFAEASRICETVLTFPGLTGILRQVIEFQQRLCAQGDLAAHTVVEVVPPGG